MNYGTFTIIIAKISYHVAIIGSLICATVLLPNPERINRLSQHMSYLKDFHAKSQQRLEKLKQDHAREAKSIGILISQGLDMHTLLESFDKNKSSYAQNILALLLEMKLIIEEKNKREIKIQDKKQEIEYREKNIKKISWSIYVIEIALEKIRKEQEYAQDRLVPFISVPLSDMLDENTTHLDSNIIDMSDLDYDLEIDNMMTIDVKKNYESQMLSPHAILDYNDSSSSDMTVPNKKRKLMLNDMLSGDQENSYQKIKLTKFDDLCQFIPVPELPKESTQAFEHKILEIDTQITGLTRDLEIKVALLPDPAQLSRSEGKKRISDQQFFIQNEIRAIMQQISQLQEMKQSLSLEINKIINHHF